LTARFSWDRLAQVWLEGILTPMVSLLGLIGRTKDRLTKMEKETRPNAYYTR